MKQIKPIQSEHDTEWHWWAFSDFCSKKALVREPSPHLQMIGELTEDSSLEDKIWFSILYAAYYNIPSALATWYYWPWEEVLEEPGLLHDWLGEHWSGTTTRTERRAVRTVTNMNQCLQSAVSWAHKTVPGYLLLGNTHENYDHIWQETDQSLRFMGRYIIIRLLEALHRFCGLQPILYDIRSIGGWSPKRALGLLWPDQLGLLLSSDTKENIAKVDKLAFETMDIIENVYGVPMSPYVFAAMLCEYRVAYENRHQYPGWTIDQEPAYWEKIKPHWAKDNGLNQFVEEKFFGTRKALFPNECLGELHGWQGTRIEPRSVLRDYGYNWCDTVYDFRATTDFSQPVRR